MKYADTWFMVGIRAHKWVSEILDFIPLIKDLIQEEIFSLV